MAPPIGSLISVTGNTKIANSASRSSTHVAAIHRSIYIHHRRRTSAMCGPARRATSPLFGRDHLQGSNVMALDPRGAALALHRFGFGPKAGSIQALAAD